MKFIRIAMICCLILLSGSTFADTRIDLKSKPPANACSTPAPNSTQVAGRGCCSHHGGVCGCSGGRAACCDGQLSPSCGCNSDSIRELMNPSKTKG